MKRIAVLFAAGLTAIVLAAPPANAHFPFILPDKNAAPQASIIFSETLEPADEVDISILSGAKLTVTDAAGKQAPAELEKGKNALKLKLLGTEPAVLSGVVDLGVMQRGQAEPHVLVYYPKAIVGDAFNPKVETGAKVELIPTGKAGALQFRFVVDGKPVAAAEVAVLVPGAAEQRVRTDEKGLTPPFSASGRYGAWARNWEDKPGERDGKKYAQVRSYVTLVIDVGAAAPSARSAPHGDPTAGGDTPDPRHRQHALPQLPEPTSSFGAVACDGFVYVYGGHVARTHKYDTAAVSGRFSRLKLDGGMKWEELPAGPALQGMNLATYDGKVFRIGGMQPKNAPGTKTDTQSVADCARFNAVTNKWEPLPSLPQPRSSHDVAVVGDKLYVFGGWWMQGAKGEAWPAEGLVLDLKDPAARWQAIPQPFQRRALIAAVNGTKIYVIGGFTADSEPKRTVDVFDTVTAKWLTGPDLPAEDQNGFAPAACAFEGKVFASVGDGSLFRLSGSGDTWEKVTTTTPRIVHRLVPWGQQILVLGGAAKGGNLDLVESVNLSPDAQAAAGLLKGSSAKAEGATK